jgi:hypothetical protein
MEIWIEEPSGFHFEEFGNIQIYRPSYSSEIKLRIESEAYLRSKFDSGIYNNPQEINKILLHQFDFYSKKLDEIIPKLASRHLIEFILFEFDQASTIEENYKYGKLSYKETARWSEIGSKFRRAAKFLAERVVLLQPDEASDAPEESLIDYLDEVWIAAEEMVNLYILSDQTFMVFPNETIVEILPESAVDVLTNFWSLNVNKECNIKELVRRDTMNRASILGEDSKFLTNISYHDQIIGNSLRKTVGVSYNEAISLLILVIRDSLPAPEKGFPILFIHYANLVETLHQHTKKSKESIEAVLDGFTLRKIDMNAEGREVWKPKQEYRAFRRAFFEMPHSTGKHLAFSKSMALEALNQLAIGVAFKQFPSEWRSKETSKALANLSIQTGKWFEKVVHRRLGSLEIIGLKSIKQIGKNNHVVKIPSNVGEIDFLGYSEKDNFLLIAECKAVQGSFEGKFFRDDIKEFSTSRKSYLKKYNRKVEWLKNNALSVIDALNSIQIYKKHIQPTKLATAIITCYPTIAQDFIDDYPCTSITNLILDYRNHGGWAYSKGVFPIPEITYNNSIAIAKPR